MSQTAVVTASDRLTFTLFVAAVIHAVLLFGMTFTAPQGSSPQVMEVTLAQHSSNESNPDADFLSNANQKGSGTLAEAALLTSTHQSPFKSALINDTVPREQVQESKKSERERQILSTTGESDRKIQRTKSQEDRDENVDVKDPHLQQATQTEDIASLEARLAAKRNAYAKRPKVRTVSSVSTRYDRDATYIDAFRTKVEQIGNRNYPAIARQRKLQGNVRLLVAILPNGTVDKITVLKGSGHKILDEAAIRSVRLAEPFQAFPQEIRRDTDILQIIRTWKFADSLTSDAS